jgi:hypothetical protein
MGYLTELHSAHMARLARLGGIPPRHQPKPVPAVEAQEPPPPQQPEQRQLPRFDYLNVRTVMSVVAATYGVTVNDLKSHDRHLHIVRPRQIAMTIAHEVCRHRSYPQLGKDFGSRDHTTIMHAVRVIAARMAANPEMAEEVERVKQTVVASCTSK